jgi:hypothetical protein
MPLRLLDIGSWTAAAERDFVDLCVVVAWRMQRLPSKLTGFFDRLEQVRHRPLLQLRQIPLRRRAPALT